MEIWASSKRGGPDGARGRRTRSARCSGRFRGRSAREGDGPGPRGVYKVCCTSGRDSSFYLAANVGYPNALRLDLGGGHSKPGGEIMIHGRCASIGCMAMTDERMQELWVIGNGCLSPACGDPVCSVHIFPGARDGFDLMADPASRRSTTRSGATSSRQDRVRALGTHPGDRD